MIFHDIWLDVQAVKERDPAARNSLEVLLLYQGVHALIFHRFAHFFYKKKRYFIARLISQIARKWTLIEIHPGAQLGHGILIVGTNKGKRHPTLGKNVTVGCGAKILGAFEVGDNCKIAANAVLLKGIESDVTAAGIPARPVRVAGVAVPKEINIDFTQMQLEIDLLAKRVEELEKNAPNAQQKKEKNESNE